MLSARAVSEPRREKSVLDLLTDLNAWAALSPGWPVLAGMRSSPVLESLAGWGDVIDVEFGQLLPVVPMLRRWGPKAALVCTEHDVVSQTFARRGDSVQPGLGAGIPYSGASSGEIKVCREVNRSR